MNWRAIDAATTECRAHRRQRGGGLRPGSPLGRAAERSRNHDWWTGQTATRGSCRQGPRAWDFDRRECEFVGERARDTHRSGRVPSTWGDPRMTDPSCRVSEVLAMHRLPGVTCRSTRADAPARDRRTPPLPRSRLGEQDGKSTGVPGHLSNAGGRDCLTRSVTLATARYFRASNA